MPPLRKKSTKFSRKATAFKRRNRRTRSATSLVGRKYGNFVPGYDRVGGLYKLNGPVKRGGELKYSDKSWSLDATNRAINRDDSAQIQWTTAAGAEAPTTMQANVWWIAQSLNTLKQGQGPSDRIGRKVTLKSLYSKMGLSVVGDNHAPMDYWARVVWVLDKQCNGGLVTIADLFEPVTDNDARFDQGGNLSIGMLPNMGNSQRFVTLKDDTFKITKNFLRVDENVAAGTPFAYSGTFSAFRDTWLPCDIEIEQVGTTAQISGIKSNNIICAVIVAGMPAVQGEDGNVPMDNIKIWGNVRARYDDN